jgi:hypothetical protein
MSTVAVGVGADRSRRIGAWRIFAAVVAVCVGAVTSPRASQSNPEHAALSLERPTLAEAQRLFYNARYEEAAALTLALRSSEPADLAS